MSNISFNGITHSSFNPQMDPDAAAEALQVKPGGRSVLLRALWSTDEKTRSLALKLFTCLKPELRKVTLKQALGNSSLISRALDEGDQAFLQILRQQLNSEEIVLLLTQKGYSNITVVEEVACYEPMEKLKLLLTLLDPLSDAQRRQVLGINQDQASSSVIHPMTRYGMAEKLAHLAQNLPKEDWDLALRSSNADGDTPLHLAAARGDLKLFETFLPGGMTLGPDHIKANAKGHTILDLFLIHARSATDLNSFFQLLGKGLMERAWESSVDEHTPMHSFAQNSQIDDLEQLWVRLDAKQRTQALRPRRDGYTAFHLAIESGNLNMAQSLLKKMPKHEFERALGPAGNGRTPLHSAAAGGHYEALKFCLELLPKMTPTVQRYARVPDNEGNTLLHLLASAGCNGFAQFLSGEQQLQLKLGLVTRLTAGLDQQQLIAVLSPNKKGETVLSLARHQDPVFKQLGKLLGELGQGKQVIAAFGVDPRRCLATADKRRFLFSYLPEEEQRRQLLLHIFCTMREGFSQQELTELLGDFAKTPVGQLLATGSAEALAKADHSVAKALLRAVTTLEKALQNCSNSFLKRTLEYALKRLRELTCLSLGELELKRLSLGDALSVCRGIETLTASDLPSLTNEFCYFLSSHNHTLSQQIERLRLFNDRGDQSTYPHAIFLLKWKDKGVSEKILTELHHSLVKGLQTNRLSSKLVLLKLKSFSLNLSTETLEVLLQQVINGGFAGVEELFDFFKTIDRAGVSQETLGRFARFLLQKLTVDQALDKLALYTSYSFLTAKGMDELLQDVVKYGFEHVEKRVELLKKTNPYASNIDSLGTATQTRLRKIFKFEKGESATQRYLELIDPKRGSLDFLGYSVSMQRDSVSADALRRCMNWVDRGEFSEKRYGADNSVHVKKLYELRPELKKALPQLSATIGKLKVGDLLNLTEKPTIDSSKLCPKRFPHLAAYHKGQGAKASLVDIQKAYRLQKKKGQGEAAEIARAELQLEKCLIQLNEAVKPAFARKMLRKAQELSLLLERKFKRLPDEFARALRDTCNAYQIETYDVFVTDDYWDLFRVGSDFFGSCMTLKGSPKALLGYVMSGQYFPIVVKAPGSDRIVARRMLHIPISGYGKEAEPALYLETLYGDIQSQAVNQAIVAQAKRVADQLKMCLYGISATAWNTPIALRSIGCAAPSVYSDAGHGISLNGVFTIHNSASPYKPKESSSDAQSSSSNYTDHV